MGETCLLTDIGRQLCQVIKGLRQTVTKQGLFGSKRKTLTEVAAYFDNNKHRMRYAEYLAQGLPIASGPVEGACKNLIKSRIAWSDQECIGLSPWPKQSFNFGPFILAETSKLIGHFTFPRTKNGSIHKVVGPWS